MFRNLLRRIIIVLGRLACKVLLDLTINGRHNLPAEGPLIIIGNHFSWFEAPLISIWLPYRTRYVGATELQRSPIFRIVLYAFETIPIWRGQIDRVALRRARRVLKAGGVIGIMPEGGIDPTMRDRVNAGEMINEIHGHTARESATLIQAQPGAAYLAVVSGAPILPVALIGTEKILDNILRLRRTAVTMNIGPVFGPLSFDDSLRGKVRREALDQLGDEMMMHLAAEFPPENRGAYA